MRKERIRLISVLVLVAVFLFSSACFAQELTLIQKFIYKKVYVLVPTNQTVLALVNRFTGEAEYTWGAKGWIEAPEHIKHCYRNRATIRRQMSR